MAVAKFCTSNNEKKAAGIMIYNFHDGFSYSPKDQSSVPSPLPRLEQHSVLSQDSPFLAPPTTLSPRTPVTPPIQSVLPDLTYLLQRPTQTPIALEGSPDIPSFHNLIAQLLAY
jgi:hypothetical protein